MPPPSQLAIATSSVRRLMREENSYRKELVDQEKKVKLLEEKIKNGESDEDGNGEFMLRQHKTAVEETKAVFGPLGKRIDDAVAKLEEQLAAQDKGAAKEEEVEQAKAALAEVKAAQTEAS
ncbi:hypothetical protein HJFPF1_00893 [Paramyrothecium foliicola]|nr:hypothetical protein HJFPF1_00893 [Paramyrothecium foliicola]